MLEQYQNFEIVSAFMLYRNQFEIPNFELISVYGSLKTKTCFPMVQKIKHPHYAKWLKLSALMPAIAMIFTDQSILPVALPSIQEHLASSHVELWWCINAYLVSSAVLLLAGGKLGDRIGHKSAFMWGMVIFALSSAMCGFSYHIYWLIMARALQGAGAALMVPASSVLIMSFFPQKERGKAIGINVSVGSVFLIMAPLLGGYIAQAFSWRWIFWINLPIAALGLLWVQWLVPPSAKGQFKFDPKGFTFFIFSSMSLILMIMQAGEWGILSKPSLILFFTFLVAGYLFYYREKKIKDPLLDLALFSHPIYRAVNISVFIVQFVLMITVYRVVFFQEAMGWSPVKSGAISSLTSMPILFMSPIGGWLADRSGPKVPIAIGFSLLISSFFWLSIYIESSLAMILLGLLAFGISVPLIFTPSYSAAMSSIPSAKAGLAFGILATVRALSAAFGVAMITFLQIFLEKKFFEDYLASSPDLSVLNINSLTSLSMANILNFYGDLTTDQMQMLAKYIEKSQFNTFIAIHVAMGVLLAFTFAYVFAHYHRKASHHLPESPAEGWD